MRSEPISKERAERVARMYKTNSAAEEALGISRGQLTKICRRFNIETPRERSIRVKSTKTYGLYSDEN